MDVLIIGLGSIAAKHIAALKHIEIDVNIIALRSDGANEIIGVQNIFNISELKVKPAFVIISNPTFLHSQTILNTAALGIPLFIEKPPMSSLLSLNKVLTVINDRKILTYVACNLRFHPCIKFLKEFLEININININEINIYCGSYLRDWRPGKNYRELYSVNPEMGGGVHLDLFHEFDYVVWLFGMPDSYCGFRSSKSTLNIDAADYANHLLLYENFNVSIVLNYYRRDPKRSIEIVFDHGTWIVDLINNSIISDGKTVIFQQKEYKIAESYIDQMEYFVSCLKDKRQPMNSFQESTEILKISLSDVSGIKR